jgi:hypothetical protein
LEDLINGLYLTMKIECVIDDEAKTETVLRTTMYKIDTTGLDYLAQWYDKKGWVLVIQIPT